MTNEKKYAVACFSKTGNNRFLAEKVAEGLNADVLEIIPKSSSILWLYLCSLLRVCPKIKLSAQQIEPYDTVIVMGPIWGGLLICPLKMTIRLCSKLGKQIHFGTCCGTSDEQKDHRFGYAQVLTAARKVGGESLKTCVAFPQVLALDENDPTDAKSIQDTRLNEDNYRPALRQRVETWLDEIRNS